MSTSTSPRSDVTALTKRNKIGLALALVLGVFDLGDLKLTNSSTSGQSNGLPFGVAVAATVLGLITVIAVIYAWRTSRRIGSRIVAGSRILSAVGALPAFFAGVTAGLEILVSGFVLLTALAAGLVLSRR